MPCLHEIIENNTLYTFKFKSVNSNFDKHYNIILQLDDKDIGNMLTVTTNEKFSFENFMLIALRFEEYLIYLDFEKCNPLKSLKNIKNADEKNAEKKYLKSLDLWYKIACEIQNNLINEILSFLVFEAVVTTQINFIQLDAMKKFKEYDFINNENSEKVFMHSFNFLNKNNVMEEQLNKGKYLKYTIFAHSEKNLQRKTKQTFFNSFQFMIKNNIKQMQLKAIKYLSSKLTTNTKSSNTASTINPKSITRGNYREYLKKRS